MKLLALDPGLARIGVATCDPLGLVARPLMILERTSRRADFAKLADLMMAQEAQAVICGLPVNMDGSESQNTRTTRKWATRLAYALRAILGEPKLIIFWDERLTTFAAQQILAAHGDRKTGEDAAAAAVILQSYLDAQRRGGDVDDFGRILLPARELPIDPVDEVSD